MSDERIRELEARHENDLKVLREKCDKIDELEDRLRKAETKLGFAMTARDELGVDVALLRAELRKAEEERDKWRDRAIDAERLAADLSPIVALQSELERCKKIWSSELSDFASELASRGHDDLADIAVTRLNACLSHEQKEG